MSVCVCVYVGVCARVLAWVSYFVSPHDIGKDAYWEIRMFLFDFFTLCTVSITCI